mmetsp:Transcript_50187/g.166197  ORF Transcript_50187/g.166197 Transcript_50187/m.166197 type:complete len:215 (+) Transcript_50187:11-655(+)
MVRRGLTFAKMERTSLSHSLSLSSASANLPGTFLLVKVKLVRHGSDWGADAAHPGAAPAVPVDARLASRGAGGAALSGPRHRRVSPRELEQAVDVAEAARVGPDGGHYLVEAHRRRGNQLSLPVCELPPTTDRQQRAVAAQHHRARAQQPVAHPDPTVVFGVASIHEVRDDDTASLARLHLLKRDAERRPQSHAVSGGGGCRCGEEKARDRVTQ